jgi:hypothetical protein
MESGEGRPPRGCSANASWREMASWRVASDALWWKIGPDEAVPCRDAMTRGLPSGRAPRSPCCCHDDWLARHSLRDYAAADRRAGSDDEVQGEAKQMRSTKMPFWILAILVFLPAQAFAAGRQSKEQAKERMAKKSCLAGDPAKGVEILAELYVDTDDIVYIFNQGRCFEQNRRYEDAIGRFREYLVKGENLSAEDKAVAQKRIEACESYLPKTAPVPARAPVAPIVQPAPVPVSPVVVTSVNQPQQVDNKAGAGLRIAGITVASIGAAALITGVVLNFKVNSMSSDLSKPDNFNRDTDSSRKDYTTLGWVSYGVGAACLAGGSLLYYLGWRSGRDSAPSVALVPNLAPDMAGALLRGAF